MDDKTDSTPDDLLGHTHARTGTKPESEGEKSM